MLWNYKKQGNYVKQQTPPVLAVKIINDLLSTEAPPLIF